MSFEILHVSTSINDFSTEFGFTQGRGRELGMGGFGTVVSCTDERYVVKIVPFKRLNTPKRVEMQKREIALQHYMTHPTDGAVVDIVGLYGHAVDDSNHYLALERMDGDLYHLAARHNETGFELSMVRSIAKAVLSAVALMHSLGIVHRDIKPPNIMYRTGKDGQIIFKLSDFGFAKVLDSTSNTMCVTPGYEGPEFVSQCVSGQQLITRAALPNDLFACGVTLYWLVCGKLPFPLSVHCLQDAHIRGDKQMLKSIIDEKEAGPQFKEGIWEAATFKRVRMIINDLLNPVPNCRVSAVLLLNKSFFSENVPDVRGAANLDDASMRELNAATAPDDLIISQVVNRPPEEDAS